MADDIRDWLERIGLADHWDAFVENAVDPALLPHLTNDDLKDLGIAKLGDRKKLLLAIAELDAEPTAPEPAPIHGWFTEGLDTPHLSQAKTFLEHLP